jgi:hypothetical protein
MAVFTFSALSTGQAIWFNPNADVLKVTIEGANRRVSVLNGTDVVPLSTAATPLFDDNPLSTAGHDGRHAPNGTAAGINLQHLHLNRQLGDLNGNA